MVPRPDAVSASHSKDWHVAHAGLGGWRRVPQFEHRWINSLCSLAPSKKNRLSWVRAGRGRLGLTLSSGAFSLGLNLRMRNSMVATGSPFWSVYSDRVVTKWPTPNPVAFSPDTESMTEVTWSWSPGTNGRS